jgi:hypothetical protein
MLDWKSIAMSLVVMSHACAHQTQSGGQVSGLSVTTQTATSFLQN